MWDLPRPGIDPVFPALAGGFLTTEQPRKSEIVNYQGLGCLCCTSRRNPMGCVESRSAPEQSSLIKGSQALHRARVQLHQNLNFTGSQYTVRHFLCMLR